LHYSLLLLLLFIKRPITIICILESVGIVLRFITVKDDDLLEWSAPGLCRPSSQHGWFIHEEVQKRGASQVLIHFTYAFSFEAITNILVKSDYVVSCW